MKITIGLTRTDPAADYVPSMDGYRKGAEQDVVVLDVPAGLPTEKDKDGWETVGVGEAYFVATNAPEEVVNRDPLAKAIYAALMERGHDEDGINHRLTMSVGDTVQVDDGPLVECKSFGWEVVA